MRARGTSARFVKVTANIGSYAFQRLPTSRWAGCWALQVTTRRMTCVLPTDDGRAPWLRPAEDATTVSADRHRRPPTASRPRESGRLHPPRVRTRHRPARTRSKRLRPCARRRWLAGVDALRRSNKERVARQRSQAGSSSARPSLRCLRLLRERVVRSAVRSVTAYTVRAHGQGTRRPSRDHLRNLVVDSTRSSPPRRHAAVHGQLTGASAACPSADAILTRRCGQEKARRSRPELVPPSRTCARVGRYSQGRPPGTRPRRDRLPAYRRGLPRPRPRLEADNTSPAQLGILSAPHGRVESTATPEPAPAL